MIRVTRSAVVDAPIDEVWEVLRDFNSHTAWHPIVERSEIENGESSDRVGCVRAFTLKDGNRIREQLLALSDSEYLSTYCILDATLPMRRYVATLQLKPVTDGARTFWHWQSTFGVPRGREREFAGLVGDGVYQAGFDGLRAYLLERSRASGAGAQPRVASHGGAVASRGEAVASRGEAVASRGDAVAMRGEAVFVERHGGPEVLVLRQQLAQPPGAGEARIRQTAIGVNYVDVYVRRGLAALITPPAVPGMEAAGTVVDVGPGVVDVAPGDRVAYACPPPGSYCSLRTLPAAQLVRLPPSIDDETAAAALLKGLSAEYLLHRIRPVGRGDRVLVHAAAGGLGLMLCEWAAALGATVIGTVSTEEKAAIARRHGCEHPIVTADYRFADRVLELTAGRGVDIVYDGIGQAAAEQNFAAIATTGLWVSYGQASGALPAIDPGRLESKSVSLSRPVVFHYTADPKRLAEMSQRLFDALERRAVSVRIGGRYRLADAAQAHRDLESRRTSGSLILVP
jgi:NADPH:quinone reductase